VTWKHDVVYVASFLKIKKECQSSEGKSLYSKGYWWICHDEIIKKKYWGTRKENLENTRHTVPRGKEWYVIRTVHCSEKIKLHVKKAIESRRGRNKGSWSSKRGKKEFHHVLVHTVHLGIPVIFLHLAIFRSTDLRP